MSRPFLTIVAKSGTNTSPDPFILAKEGEIVYSKDLKNTTESAIVL